MMNKISQSSSELGNQFSLIEVALEMYYGNLDALLSPTDATKDNIEDRIDEIKRQIERLREQVKKIEAVARKMEKLLPKILDAVGSDKGAADCPELDSRRVEFFRLWNQPLIVTAGWEMLAQRFSQAEKSLLHAG